jgi:type I restriction enzyme, R subunit
MNDPAAVEAFKAEHYLSDEDLAALQASRFLPSARSRITAPPTTTSATGCAGKGGQPKRQSTIDWDDVVFEVDLLKSQEINLDYILELIFEQNKKSRTRSRWSTKCAG